MSDEGIILQLSLTNLRAAGTCSRSFVMTGHSAMFPQITPPYCCRICGDVVELETCKTDEHGIAVHEGCYVAAIVLASDPLSLIRKPPRSLPLRVDLKLWG